MKRALTRWTLPKVCTDRDMATVLWLPSPRGPALLALHFSLRLQSMLTEVLSVTSFHISAYTISGRVLYSHELLSFLHSRLWTLLLQPDPSQWSRLIFLALNQLCSLECLASLLNLICRKPFLPSFSHLFHQRHIIHLVAHAGVRDRYVLHSSLCSAFNSV